MYGMKRTMRKRIKGVMPWRVLRVPSLKILAEMELRVGQSRICLVRMSTRRWQRRARCPSSHLINDHDTIHSNSREIIDATSEALQTRYDKIAISYGWQYSQDTIITTPCYLA